MKSSNYQLTSFFNEIKTQLRKDETSNFEINDFQEMITIKGDCFFVVDLTQSKILHFGGMQKMFGYKDSHIDLPFVFDKNHPDDSVLVQSVVRNILSKIVHMAIPEYTNVFSMTSRFQKSNGEYIRVMTDNFIIQTNGQHIVQSILVKYTDLSFLDTSTTVDWKVNPEFLDKNVIAKEIYGQNKNIFTEREQEIIKLIFSGSSNSEIATSLSISQHTVATHRKNIFSKSKCSSTSELKIFCKKSGVFNGNNF